MYQAQKHYRSLSIASRIEAASPHELVAILYEELLRALDVTRTALAQGKGEACRSARERSSAILLALEGSLDFEAGGELARNLSGVYRSMQKELAASVQSGDAHKLEVVRACVADLLSAWARIRVREAA